MRFRARAGTRVLARVVCAAFPALLAGAVAARAQSEGTARADSASKVARVDSTSYAARADSARVPKVSDYIWVVRSGLDTPADCDRVVGRAVALGLRGLLVQVVGRGDAYYRSDLLPRAESLTDSTFDPLGYLLPRAHEAGLEVHAWMNCFLVWSAPRSPRDSTHVVRAHPDWLTWARGSRVAGHSRRARRRAGRSVALAAPDGEGFYLAPSRPEVRTFVANVAGEILDRYPVDGLHLDYIRYPAADVSVDARTRDEFIAFASAPEAAPDSAASAAPADTAGIAAEIEAGAGPRWERFRCRQVTAFLAEVRDTLVRRRPQAQLSAAVLADTNSARSRGQDWPGWLRAGLLDQAFPMCYQPSTANVMSQLERFKETMGADRVVPGIACYNQAPKAAAAKLKVARALGFSRVALFSYDALFSQRGYRRALESYLE